MKGKEVPIPLVIGFIVVVLVGVGVLAYNSFIAPPKQMDPAKELSASRLEDPDPPRSGDSEK